MTLRLRFREAFDSARRRLEDHLRELRREVTSHALPSVARVARIFPSEGYGILATSDNREVYFHRNAVLDGHLDDLKPGTTVRVAEEEGEEGPQASSIAVLGAQHQVTTGH